MIGSVIDKYEVLRKVGEGGMATVYLGKHTTLGRVVAIKVLHPHLSASTRNRLRFAREARAIEHLDHENILKIFDYSGTDVEDCYIVTEFVDGRTLHELLQERGLLPSEVAARIGVKLCLALAYAHRAGIIHRDLKPENVMLRADGTVKLMDFGIARFLDETTVTMTGALVGSPAYMSPEQALEKVVDARSDLFSLGTLLYHLVTGRLPFGGSNPSIVLRNIIESRRDELLEVQPGASSRLASVIERLLETDPEGRFETAMQVREALEAVLEEAEVESSAWDLPSYLADPDAYEEQLSQQLDEVLLRRGREAFRAGDHLGAQRLFNRLLATDPEHAEVLEILSSVQHPPDVSELTTRDGSDRRWLPLLGAVAVLGLAGLAWWALEPGTAAPVEAQESVLEPEPTLVAELGVSPVPEDLDPVLVEPVEPEPLRVRPEPPGTGARLERDPVDQPSTEATPETVADAPPPEPVAPARVTLKRRGRGQGNVYVDGEYVGALTQNVELELTPGAHVLRVVNEMSRPWEQELDLSPGQALELPVKLTKLPLTLTVDETNDPLCELSLDGQPRGSLEKLDYRVELDVPGTTRKVEVTLACTDQAVREALVEGQAGTTRSLFPQP